MLITEWIAAANQTLETVDSFNRAGLRRCLGDAASFEAACAIYRSCRMDAILTAQTSAERHQQLADWCVKDQHGRRVFARLRAQIGRRLMLEAAADLVESTRINFGHLYLKPLAA